MQKARLPTTNVTHTYSWIAPIHDWLAVLVEPKARKLGLDWLNTQDGETVLEVAVGTGLSLPYLLRTNPSGWTEGIDLTPAMLQRAQRRAEHVGQTNYRLQIGNAYALPFPADTFDAVINSYMFDLLPESDFVSVLSEYCRVLKPGGRLVQMHMTLGNRWYNQLWEGFYHLYPPLLGGCRGIQLEPSYHAAGFQQVRRAYISQWTFASEILYGQKPL